MRKLARRHGRSGAGRLLVEGPDVVAEAREYLEQVLISERAGEAAERTATDLAAGGVDVRYVDAGVFESVADTVTPRGIVGMARLPEPDLPTVLEDARLALLCCGLADPGNLGTVLRTADAAGADAVIVGAGSVDPANPKAVRASAGSLFHLPVVDDVEPARALVAARRAGLRPVGADASASTPHTDADLAAPTLLVLGGEAAGLPAEVAHGCAELVRIPMLATPRPGYRGVAESLNLAATAAVLAFEAARQRAPRTASPGAPESV
ncbi:RNA methyltransferase [Egibacter rhizosphaerae]|uniref:RNA methyltransferase n=1 Tax=Egibacter rhizosphaerae TaxID=1670831 RepID=A0A411YK20_9ACTN|nr:RNA methyltransferase [Egibacter rhizosphaerae]QBI21558.1 RNA methyltransferase [Egibacter rhizosphaerae]